MVDASARQQAIEALAQRLHEIGPPNWTQIYAAFEAKADAGGDLSLTWVLLGAVNLGDRWGFGQFDQDDVVYDLALAYHRACGDEPWNSLEVKVDHDGSFTAEQAYDPVPVGAQFSAGLMQRLQGYGQTFAAERGDAPHARR